MNKLSYFKKVRDTFVLIWHFVGNRWGKKFANRMEFEDWQKKRLEKFIQRILPQASFYSGLELAQLHSLPLMDKTTMMGAFSTRNTRAIELSQALKIAIEAENTRNFTPTIGDITIGLSSGTSGQRGIFLVSDEERLRWAGVLLAKTLPPQLLIKILLFWKTPVRISFFLRANSNLYNTLNSRRINFDFYDLLKGVESYFSSLNNSPPDALVAPATVLQLLARAKLSGLLHIQPDHIISVAEVLEEKDAELVAQAFGKKPHQIYQATEGFLAYTCKNGSLHLNESHIYFEKEWLDDEKIRFQPVITDFSRTTQLIVRYKLNDILRIASKPCPCGSQELTLAAIEGRSDEILWLTEIDCQKSQPVYPDLIRRAMALVEPALDEYTIVQINDAWEIAIKTQGNVELVEESITYQLKSLCEVMRLVFPVIIFGQWAAPALGVKRRRIRCELT